MEVISKPWGKEIWLEVNDKYCYKRIHINAGHRTSLQYHEKKLETTYVIEGEADLWLESSDGVIEKKTVKKGSVYTVHPGTRHRVTAITDVILQEASTPEVDDVIRVEDDTKRSHGRIDDEHRVKSKNA